MDRQAPVHVQLRLENCIWCGKPLPDGRYDRRSHNECRMRIHRWKKAPKRYQNDIFVLLKKIEARLDHEWSFSEAVDALKQVQCRINEIYHDHSIVRVK